jgi:hypothetical protein
MISLIITSIAAASAPSGISRSVRLATYCTAARWKSSEVAKPGAIMHFTEDNEAFRRITHVVVVVPTGPTAGLLLDYEVIVSRGPARATVVNNASYAIVKGTVRFPNPPLGGVWTQEFITRSL